MARPMYSWSYSALNMYENCPRKYWAVKIKKVNDNNKFNMQGDVEHKAIENFLKHGDPLPQSMQSMAPLLQAVKAAPGELYVEKKLTLDDQLVPCLWNDWDKAWVRGAGDLIKVNGSLATYLDWKSGKAKGDDDVVDQVETTAALLFRHFPAVQTLKAGVYFYRFDRMARHTVTANDAPRIWNGLYARLQPITESYQTDNWPMKPNPLCAYCPYLACPNNTTNERLAREAAKVR